VAPNGAEGNVGAPLTGESGALDGARDSVSGDDDAEVAPRRLDERLHECALAAEPVPVLETFESRPELGLVPAQRDVAALAPEARLHDVRGSKARE
jgi:hypothetical protein